MRRNEDVYVPSELEVERHSDIESVLYMTAAVIVILVLVFVGLVVILDWRPTGKQFDFVFVFALLLIMSPTLMVGYLKMRHILWHDRYRRKMISGTVKMIDGGADMQFEFQRDTSWFLDACQHWFESGDSSTTYANSMRQLGLSLEQWRAARDTLIKAGIADPVRRQGGNEGFRIKVKEWNNVLMKLPNAPNVQSAGAYSYARSLRR